MTVRAPILLLLACVLHFAAAPLRAAADERADAPLEEREQPPAHLPAFGSLRTWFSAVPIDQIPIELRPLRQSGKQALIPPRSRRDGLTPRVAAALQYDDNLLLTPSNKLRGGAATVAPGLNWLDESARHSIEIDASAEALGALGKGYDAVDYKTLNEATLQAMASARLLPTMSIDYAGLLFYAQEAPGDTLLPPSASNELFPTYYQNHQFGGVWQRSHTTEFETRWSGSWERSDNPEFVPTRLQDLELSTRIQTGATQRLGLRLRQRAASFDSQAWQRYNSLWLEWEQQWSPTLLTQASVAPTHGPDADQLSLWRLALTKTARFGQWNVDVGYEISPAGGIGLMYGVYSANLGTSWRLPARAVLDLSVQAARYLALEGGDPFRTLRPLLSLTVPLEDRWWLRFGYEGTLDEVPAQDYRVVGNRVRATLIRSF
ncbi:hypothetical protein [Accumulibacter sp.]|uniref:hypothetical protein n=1 Tax=Accumulibacter sp. TaxID=2053492 RepID=UPI0025F7E840|nr:hypothetical protein [Accumulibacter sp.]MCP5229426.1 hypothetical protein [Accumulibacter sp.]